MGFQHPHQRQHMLRGLAAAVKSPNTPAHLKPHIQKRLGGTMKISTPRPKGVPNSSVSTPRPRGVGSASVSTPNPKGVGSPGAITAKLGSSGATNGLPNVSSVPKTPPTVQTMIGKGFSPGEQSSNAVKVGKPSFLRTKKLATKRQGFGKGGNLRPQPNALYGEF